MLDNLRQLSWLRLIMAGCRSSVPQCWVNGICGRRTQCKGACSAFDAGRCASGAGGIDAFIRVFVVQVNRASASILRAGFYLWSAILCICSLYSKFAYDYPQGMHGMHFRYMEIESLVSGDCAGISIWQEWARKSLELRRRGGRCDRASGGEKSTIAWCFFVLLLAFLHVEHGDDGSVVSALKEDRVRRNLNGKSDRPKSILAWKN